MSCASSSSRSASASCSGNGVSSGSSIGTTITRIATIAERRSAASRQARCTASRDCGLSTSGERIIRYSSAIAGPSSGGALVVSFIGTWT